MLLKISPIPKGIRTENEMLYVPVALYRFQEL